MDSASSSPKVRFRSAGDSTDDASTSQPARNSRPPRDTADGAPGAWAEGSELELPITLAGRFRAERLRRSSSIDLVLDAIDVQSNRLVCVQWLRECAPTTLNAIQSRLQVATRLKHPSLARPIAQAQHDGGLLIVWERPAAESFEKPDPSERPALMLVLRQIVALAEGLHQAHKARLVHPCPRAASVQLSADKMPQWIDLPLTWEVLAQARELEEAPGIVAVPPEQLASASNGIADTIAPTVAGNVYSLGVLLYQLVTGRPPFAGKTAAELRHAILRDEVIPPSHYRDSIPREIDVICLKCLARDPAKRFSSAAALATAIKQRAAALLKAHRLLEQQGIAGLLQLALRSRERFDFSEEVLLLSAVPLADRTEELQRRLDQAEANLAELERLQNQIEALRPVAGAEQQVEGLLRQVIQLRPRHAETNTLLKRIVGIRRAEALLESEGVSKSLQRDWREWLLAVPTLVGTLVILGAVVFGIYFVTKGYFFRRSIVADRVPAERGGPRPAPVERAWKEPEPKAKPPGETLALTRPLTELNTPADERGPWLSADGLTLFWWLRGPEPQAPSEIWTATRPDFDSRFTNRRRLTKGESPTFSDDLLEMIYLPTRSKDETLHVARRATVDAAFAPGVPLAEFQGFRVDNPWLSADGLTLLMEERGAKARSILMSTRASREANWSVPARVEVPNAATPDDRHRAPFLSADGLTLFGCYARAVGDKVGGQLCYWQRATPEASFGTPVPIQVEGAGPELAYPRYFAKTGELYFVNFPVPGDLWVTRTFIPPASSTDGTEPEPPVRQAATFRVLRGHEQPVGALALSADGQRLVSGDDANTIVCWDLTEGHPLWTSNATEGRAQKKVLAVAVAPDGQSVVVCSETGIRRLALADGKVLSQIEPLKSPGLNAAISFDAALAVVHQQDAPTSAVHTYDLRHNREVQTIKRTSPVLLLDSLGNVLCGSVDNSQRSLVLNARNGSLVTQFAGIRDRVVSAVLSSDEQRLALAGGAPATGKKSSNDVIVWKLNNGRWAKTLELQVPSGWQSALAFSPDQKFLVMGGGGQPDDPEGRKSGADTRIRILSLDSGELVDTFDGMPSAVRQLVFSPDGRQLFSISADAEIRVWDFDVQ